MEKNSSLREFDGPLSLEERRTCKTPPEMQGARCAPGEKTSKTKKDTELYSQSKILSVSDGSGKNLGHHLKASWYGWRNK